MMELPILEDIGRRVLKDQAAALLRTAVRLDAQFAAAVRSVKGSTGKVITTGLGKSGHVARKVAATLSSTGTPSAFLHPAEALHGDLGFVDQKDTLLAIAFGGETAEVLEVVKYAKRHDIKVIAITGQLQSSLAKLADFCLDGSIEREACPLGLAPTTSTTVAMALGDSFAVALMEDRGFKAEDFARFHPGGSLGRRLALVQDLLHGMDELAPIGLEDTFHEVLLKVTKNNFGIAAVVDDRGVLCGAVTDGDLRRALFQAEERVFKLKAGEMMTAHPKTTSAETTCIAAFKLMESHKITSLFVVGPERTLLGLIRMHDILAARIV